MNIKPSIATQVCGICLFGTIETNLLCKYKCNIYFDTALACYIGHWNLCSHFGVKYLVGENLVFELHCQCMHLTLINLRHWEIPTCVCYLFDVCFFVE